MANRIPLIVNSDANQIQELPTSDNLQLNDTNKLVLGTGAELQISHDSTGTSRIVHTPPTGGDDLRLQIGALGGNYSGTPTGKQLILEKKVTASGNGHNFITCDYDSNETRICFADSSTGSTKLTTKSTGVDITGILNASGIVNANDTTQSTNTTSGSLVVDGGVGIAKNLYVGGSTNIGTLIITDTTQSTNKDTGALIVEGGVGIEKNLSVGEQLNLTGTSAAGDSDINLSGGSDALAVVTNTSNSGKISFVTKSSGGTNSTVQLEHQKVNFSGPDISGTAVTFEPKGAAPIIGVRAYGFIQFKKTDGTYTADINGVNIASYEREDNDAAGMGRYKINFTNAMPHANYAVMLTPDFIDGDTGDATRNDGANVYLRHTTRTTTSCIVVGTDTAHDPTDRKDVSFSIAIIC